VLARPANHRSPAIASADHKGSLQNGWKNDDALGFFQEFLRNVVGYAHHFLHDGPGIFQTFLFLVRREERTRSKHNADTQSQFTKHHEPPQSV
jgi:hypothetical protein